MASRYYKDANGKKYSILENNTLFDGEKYYAISSATKVPVEITVSLSKFQPQQSIVAESINVAHVRPQIAPLITNTTKSAYLSSTVSNVVSN